MPKLTKLQQTERDDAITTLRAMLSPGQTVYCLLRRVSASGMSRDISFYALDDGSMRFLDGLMSKALGMTRSKRDGLKVQGCGMDMGFATVYDLGRALYPEGFGLPCRGRGCAERKADKHFATACTSEDTDGGHAYYGRNGDTSGWDNDGGYALKREWL